MKARHGFYPDRGNLLSRYSADLGQCVSRRRSEIALRAAAMEHATANRAKSEFLANMSHELRTPLNAIIGFSEAIQHLAGDDPAVARPVEYAGLISRAGRHLLNIISDILDLSKIESGTFTLDLESESLAELLHSSIDLIKPRVAEKNQALLVKLPPDLPNITADGRRLKQVVINLLSNAHKFTPECGRIIITASVEPGGTVIIAIRDSGIGMTREQIDVALKPFGQVRSATTRGHEGTGLGLPISKSVIEQHGGRFMLTSTPNAGTTAAFVLPMQSSTHTPKRPHEERVS
jgi:two-component system cell cycle sensor histidine kinase PleC